MTELKKLKLSLEFLRISMVIATTPVNSVAVFLCNSSFVGEMLVNLTVILLVERTDEQTRHHCLYVALENFDIQNKQDRSSDMFLIRILNNT